MNNALSRVGPQLATALIFIVANSIFFSTLGDLAPDLDTSSEAVRSRFSPLNAPADGTDLELVAASADASNDAFRAGMLLAAGLLAGGAVVSAAGVRNPPRAHDGDRVAVPVAVNIPNCAPLDVDCLPDEGAGSSAAA